jgi:hypothetical protein
MITNYEVSKQIALENEMAGLKGIRTIYSFTYILIDFTIHALALIDNIFRLNFKPAECGSLQLSGIT